MKIFRLEPLPEAANDHNWKASTYKGDLVIRAPDEGRARDIAMMTFGIAVERGPGAFIATNPWPKRMGLATCSEVSDPQYPAEGDEAILYPAVHNHEWRRVSQT